MTEITTYTVTIASVIGIVSQIEFFGAIRGNKSISAPLITSPRIIETTKDFFGCKIDWKY